MSPIDVAMVERKLDAINERLRHLQPLVGFSLEGYQKDHLRRSAAERWLQTLIDAAIDVNSHLLIDAGGPVPDDYHSSFISLATRLKVLPYDLAARLAPSAGLRNRLVHEYDEIDDARVLEAIVNALRDYPEYVRAIARYVAAAESASSNSSSPLS